MTAPEKSRRVQMRRAIKRIPASFQADQLEGTGQLAKVSREGIFFCTMTLPPPGAAVRIVFEDSAGTKIEIEGTVRWNTAQIDASRTGFGMHIDSVNDAYLAFYEGLLTR